MSEIQATQVTVFSHKSTEYFTPPEYIEAARAVMGGIDLDPASCHFAQKWIRAECYFTKEGNGLIRPWYGRVWLNPPYSKTNGRSNQDIWARRLEDEIEAGRVECGILLVKAALGYKWFERLFRTYPVCLTRERIRFITEKGVMPRAKQANAFFLLRRNLPPFGRGYYSARALEMGENFKKQFGEFGRVIWPERERG